MQVNSRKIGGSDIPIKVRAFDPFSVQRQVDRGDLISRPPIARLGARAIMRGLITEAVACNGLDVGVQFLLSYEPPGKN